MTGVTDMHHRDGVWWHAAPVPPRDHECWAQSSGWIGLGKVERCACGGVRLNGREWFERNSRAAADG